MTRQRRSSTERTGPLERLLIAAASLVLSVGAIAILSGFFAGRDQAGVSGLQSGPGQLFPDQGAVHLRAGDLRPVYDSEPPTSGPHIAEPILRGNTELNDNQLLQALELGNVVIMYGGPAPPAGLTALARSLAPSFTPALAAAGQAVIISAHPRTAGLIGLAWRRLLRVRSAQDPQLRRFVQFWLGRGASGGQ